MIQDATACCAQGIEFVLKGNPQFPEGYPEQGDLITVSGIFEKMATAIPPALELT